MGTEKRRINTTKHIIEMLNNNPEKDFLKTKIAAEISVSEGITMGKATEYITTLIEAEYIIENGLYIYSMNRAETTQSE